MTILLTGAAGLLGTAVVQRLIAGGVRSLRCLVRPGSTAARLRALAAEHGPDVLTIACGTLTSARDVACAVEGAQVVVHMAASTRGAPADMFLNTVVGTQRLLEAIPGAAVQRLVLASSLAVYGLARLPPGSVIGEETPLDPFPWRRDVYAHTKIRQEQLVAAAAGPAGITAVVLRPGPIYGPDSAELPGRVGLLIPGLLLHLGGDTPLPLTYIDNCADAFCLALHDRVPAGAYNVIDDRFPTAAQYLRRYQREVRHVRTLRLPYFATRLLSRTVERCHVASNGQIPLAMTTYRTANLWGRHLYDTARLKSLGWQQPVPTEDALRTTFAALRRRYNRIGGLEPGERVERTDVHR